MTKYYRVFANSCDFGLINADSEQDARDIAARIAGYLSEKQMEKTLERPSEITCLEFINAD